MNRTAIMILLSLSAVSLFAQAPEVGRSNALVASSAEQAGMSQARLDLIDQMCADAVEANQVPGIVALIARKGKVVFHQAYGTADQTGRALEGDAIFRIASQTKAITATAVMTLWEKGLFRLDDPISKYIPAFEETGVLDRFSYADTSFTIKPVEKPITIRHLLTHTSGLGYGVIDGDERFKMMYAKAGVTDLFSTKEITIEESVKKLAALPLHHQPGEKFTYSEGLDVLGYFIEVVSGQSFSDYLEEHVFRPIGMHDTHFYLQPDEYDRLVSVQHWDDDNWADFPITFYDPDYPKKGARMFYSGGAGLSSTASDYAAFLQMYLNMGEINGHRLLSRKTIEIMMKNQIGDLWNGGTDYGLAFGIVNERGVAEGGRGSQGTFDWGGYFNTQYFADPEEQIIGILMKQTQGPVQDETGWKFRQMVFSAIND
ncbi:MAG: beta-lactamase family protein [Saprospiraceae bacterium]|nr:beta-lactamase family protein [Saprospiraceae bacterium]